MLTRSWILAHGRALAIGGGSVVMGILNVTPDSFSDGGAFLTPEKALERARGMIAEGADIIDIGGESTRPGAAAISAREEQDRILPIFEALSRETDVLLSVDTYREETARLAVAAGAHIVNDVWGLQREPGIARVAAQTGAGLVIMHTGRERRKLPDVIDDQFAFLRRSLEIATEAGVADGQIVLDPGFGFAKDTDENIAIMKRFSELGALGFPLAVGTSRKRFVGAISGREDPALRGAATAATSVVLRLAGAGVFRVHDVAINRDALKVADAMLTAPEKGRMER
ncbi:dihydropteroate synthase [Nitratireductor pacificus]|uniref:Dihydropteroate synthase n=1 Tax=Nitratireductor pacificus pht-3B TaxID=391937 RepID=K2MAC4_9HYPH|nr:dihydropteroate synthase [Nitratireductor pacificus]EKF17955.1 dihydropteroate synthase [Nitratireductor pacificus pht-3B]